MWIGLRSFLQEVKIFFQIKHFFGVPFEVGDHLAHKPGTT